jgi:hypothetical protein
MVTVSMTSSASLSNATSEHRDCISGPVLALLSSSCLPALKGLRCLLCSFCDLNARERVFTLLNTNSYTGISDMTILARSNISYVIDGVKQCLAGYFQRVYNFLLEQVE